MAEAVVLARELNDMAALALTLYWAGLLAHFEGDTAEVKRLASDLIELTTRQGFASWLPGGVVLRGWARSACGNTAEGVSWIQDRIRDYQATGAALREALHEVYIPRIALRGDQSSLATFCLRWLTFRCL